MSDDARSVAALKIRLAVIGLSGAEFSLRWYQKEVHARSAWRV